MAKNPWTVDRLTKISGVDAESTLTVLWSHGIDYVHDRTSHIRRQDIERAHRAVGLGGPRKRQISYWLAEYGLSRAEFSELLQSLGLDLPLNARRMPPGSIKRLNSYLTSPSNPERLVYEDRRAELKRESLKDPPPFTWESRGTQREIQFLNSSEVVAIHKVLERDFALGEDPISPPGVRDGNLLESAVSRPRTSLFGEFKYCTVQSAGAALLHALVHNHPFHNGNKRTALVSLLVYLDRNNFVFESQEQEMYQWMLKVAAHGLLDSRYRFTDPTDRETSEIVDWIIKNSRQADHHERVITWRELVKALRSQGCEIERARGEKFIITRRLPEQGVSGRTTTKLLSAYFTNTGDGRDVPRSKLKDIRYRLELDDVHGIDAAIFYSNQREPDYFVAKYSKLLARLAKV